VIGNTISEGPRILKAGSVFDFGDNILAVNGYVRMFMLTLIEILFCLAYFWV